MQYFQFSHIVTITRLVKFYAHTTMINWFVLMSCLFHFLLMQKEKQ